MSLKTSKCCSERAFRLLTPPTSEIETELGWLGVHKSLQKGGEKDHSFSVTIVQEVRHGMTSVHSLLTTESFMGSIGARCAFVRECKTCEHSLPTLSGLLLLSRRELQAFLDFLPRIGTSSAFWQPRNFDCHVARAASCNQYAWALRAEGSWLNGGATFWTESSKIIVHGRPNYHSKPLIQKPPGRSGRNASWRQPSCIQGVTTSLCDRTHSRWVAFINPSNLHKKERNLRQVSRLLCIFL